jgi:hypothetical protein
MKISELIADDKNYNKGNDVGNALIKKSLKKHGAGTEWKDIPGYNGIYQGSNTGIIRSVDHYDSLGRSHKGRILSIKKNNKGYLLVNLFHKETKLVSRLIAITFIGNCPNKMEINHIDGNKSNNNHNNLEWVTKRENQLHRCRVLKNVPINQLLPLYKAAQEKKRLTISKVPFELLNSHLRLKDLSIVTKVSISTLSRMRRSIL